MGQLEGTHDMREAKETKAARRANARAIARHCVQNMRREPIGTGGAWLGIGEDPTPAEKTVTFDLYRSGQGWSGIVRFPLQEGAALIAKTTRTPAGPTAKQKTAVKAINLAAKISRLPGVQAIIPPQARAAVAVLKSPIAKLATKSAGKILSKLF